MVILVAIILCRWIPALQPFRKWCTYHIPHMYSDIMKNPTVMVSQFKYALKYGWLCLIFKNYIFTELPTAFLQYLLRSFKTKQILLIVQFPFLKSFITRCRSVSWTRTVAKQATPLMCYSILEKIWFLSMRILERYGMLLCEWQKCINLEFCNLHGCFQFQSTFGPAPHKNENALSNQHTYRNSDNLSLKVIY